MRKIRYCEFSLSVIVLVFVISVISCTTSFASSSFDYEEFVTMTAVHRMFQKGILGFPRELRGRNEAYVIVTAGVSYTDVKLMATGYPLDKLKAKLRNTLRAAGMKDSAMAGDWVREFYAVGVCIKKPHYGMLRAENTVAIGKLLAGMRSQGLKPYVLLRVPKYASASPLKFPKLERSRYNWYNVTKADVSFSVSTSAVVSRGLSVTLLYLRFLLPCIGFGGFIVGLALALNRSLPSSRRLAYFDTISNLLPMVVGLSGLGSLVTFHNSASARLLSDMWFANPGTENIFLFVECAVSPAILALLPLPGLAIRWFMFRKLANEPNIVDLPHLIERARKHTFLMTLLWCLFIAYLLLARPVELDPLRLIKGGAGLVQLPVTMLMMRFLMTYILGRKTPNAELTARAKELASTIGVEVKEVRVAKGSIAQNSINAFAFVGKKTIVVTQKAVEVLTPIQMDWVLAHELTHFRDYSKIKLQSKRSYVRIFCSALLLMIVMLGCYVKALPVVWLIGVLSAGSFVLVFDTLEIMHRLEYEADLQALITVGDLEQSVETLTLMSTSAKKKIDGMETDYHPKTIKRIKALRLAAERMALASAE